MASSLELNKIAGALLTAGIIASGSGVVSRILYQPSMPDEDAYPILVAEAEPAGETEGAEEPAGEPLPVLLASADASNGESVAKKCVACHSFEEGGAAKVGPPLWGVVGRDIASLEGFSYSEALTAKEGDWTYENLDGYMVDPDGWAPGNNMAFAGISDDVDRADLLVYLQSLAADPVPLPEPAAEAEGAEEVAAEEELVAEEPAAEAEGAEVAAAEDDTAAEEATAEAEGAEEAAAEEELVAAEAAAEAESAEEAAAEEELAAEEATAEAEGAEEAAAEEELVAEEAAAEAEGAEEAAAEEELVAEEPAAEAELAEEVPAEEELVAEEPAAEAELAEEVPAEEELVPEEAAAEAEGAEEGAAEEELVAEEAAAEAESAEEAAAEEELVAEEAAAEAELAEEVLAEEELVAEEAAAEAELAEEVPAAEELVTEEAAAEAEGTQQEAGAGLLASIAAADPAVGENVTRKCAACHYFEEGAPPLVGPNLHGVVGRAVASLEGYRYSDALQGLDGTWDYETLDAYLADPKGYAPGNWMGFAGIRDDDERAALIAYLKSISEDAPPLAGN